MRGATVKSKPERSDILPILMGNTVTFVIGDLVTVDSSGYLQLVTNSDEPICGVVKGFVQKTGEHVDLPQDTTTGQLPIQITLRLIKIKRLLTLVATFGFKWTLTPV